mgnify:CR=1 FL=1
MSDKQSNNPLHGVTLEAMLTELHAHYGWDGLASRIAVRCFSHEPSIKSSLAFLRRTPWARDKVEALYLQLKKPKRSPILPRECQKGGLKSSCVVRRGVFAINIGYRPRSHINSMPSPK